MTSQATRDALAEMDGWIVPQGYKSPYYLKNRGSHLEYPYGKPGAHPHPPTLDGADAAVPEGWTWTRHATTFGKWWAAYPPNWNGESYPTVPDTGDKIADLYALALACRRAMENKA